MAAELRNQLQHERIFNDLTGKDAAHSIGVVACHRHAGTTTVALNFAAMLHERTGAPTALIEANVRQPVLADHLNLTRTDGFNSFAEGGVSLRSASTQDSTTGLSVLAAEPVAMPLPLLRAAQTRLAHSPLDFRHVVFDLPPVLDVPDATILASRLDAFVLVLEAEETRWQVARAACQRLEAAGAHVLGVVLNKKPLYIPAWLYRLL